MTKNKYNAMFFQCAVSSFMDDFAYGKSKCNGVDSTHLEAFVEGENVTLVMLCANFFANEYEASKKLYKQFANYMQKYIGFFEKMETPIVLGFNYGKPGLITFSKSGIKYEEHRDICDQEFNNGTVSLRRFCRGNGPLDATDEAEDAGWLAAKEYISLVK